MLSSGVALAINTIQCKANTTCNGTEARDLVKGSAGNDSMYGKVRGDILKGFGNALSQDEYLFGQVGNTVNFTGGITTNLTINLNSSDLAHEVKNADGTSTVNWSGKAIDKVQNVRTGDDQITGNDAANCIQSVGFDPRVGVITAGADTVRAGEGTGTIFVTDRVDVTGDCGDDINANREAKFIDGVSQP